MVIPPSDPAADCQPQVLLVASISVFANQVLAAGLHQSVLTHQIPHLLGGLDLLLLSSSSPAMLSCLLSHSRVWLNVRFLSLCPSPWQLAF